MTRSSSAGTSGRDWPTSIVEAIGCSKASASDIRRGKRTPHLSTWRALAKVTVAALEFAAHTTDIDVVESER